MAGQRVVQVTAYALRVRVIARDENALVDVSGAQ
jgi:hypothetical protein